MNGQVAKVISNKGVQIAKGVVSGEWPHIAINGTQFDISNATVINDKADNCLLIQL